MINKGLELGTCDVFLLGKLSYGKLFVSSKSLHRLHELILFAFMVTKGVLHFQVALTLGVGDLAV